MSFIIAIDFDGTIVEHEFPEIGKPVPLAFTWMKRFQDAGARLILWTMRSDGRTGEGKANGPVLTEAVMFCAEQGIHFWAVNQNTEQQAWTQSPKVYAHVYVDDAGACCPLVTPYQRRPFVDWSIVGPAVFDLILAHNKKWAA